MSKTTSISTRDAMPADQLDLLTLYPRDGWRTRGGLDGTARIWLGNHDGFRELMADLAAVIDQVRDGGSDPGAFQARYRRLAGSLVAGLEGHHGIEDDYYFPMFRAAEPKLQAGFDILDGDHHRIHEACSDLTVASLDLIKSIAARDEAFSDDAKSRLDAAAAAARAFQKDLTRHLDDEEDLVIPLIIARSGG